MKSLVTTLCVVIAAASAVLLTMAVSTAQNRVVPQSREDIQLSFAPVVRASAPAVVNVYGARVQRRASGSLMVDEFFREFFGRGGGPVPRERIQRSLGSGVVVDRNLVVTNNHVIEGMTEVKISFADKREFDAEIVLADPRSDLAVLKVKALPEVTPIAFGDSEALEVGDVVLAIGNPFGVGQTVTQGIVSAVARTQVGISDYRFFIQTDAAINPGNSGGALVDMKGQLVGINTAIYSRSGGSIGLGFAIPSSMVKMVVESARAGRTYVKRPWLGARLQAVTQEMAEAIGISQPGGVMVTAVVVNGPAEKAGLHRGDVILAVDDQEVEDIDAFGYRFALRGIGGTAKLRVLRETKEQALEVKLASPPETRPRDTVVVSVPSPLMGAEVTNFSPAVAEELQMDVNEAQECVVVSNVSEGSAAERFGFKKGDLILSINRERVATTEELTQAVTAQGRFMEITLSRGGRIITTTLGGR
jgi:Do/DeqQ family serine protease